MITSIDKFFHNCILTEDNGAYNYTDGMNLDGMSGIPNGFNAVKILYNGDFLSRSNNAQATDPNASLFGDQRFRQSYFGNSQNLTRLSSNVFGSYNTISNRSNIDIQKISIIKVVPAQPIGIDIHFKFDLNENEVWGVVKKFGSHQQSVNCPDLIKVYKTIDLKYINMRILTILENWSVPKQGLYKCERDLLTYDLNGKQYVIKKGVDFSVTPNDGYGSTFYVETEKGKYKLRHDDSLIFNVICKPITSL